MQRIPLPPLAILSLLLGPLPARAALDFHTYRIQETVKQIIRDGKRIDSAVTSYVLTRLGSVSLEASTLKLTSHGSYLTVVEEATLSGNVETRPHDITEDFLFQGSLPIPALAALHRLSVYHGDSVFDATLKKQVYSLDDRFFDSLALKETLEGRVAFLQQLSDLSFEAGFTRLSLGEPIRVRIEYDLPFPGAPGAEIRVPILFHPSGSPPRQATVSFFEAVPGLPGLVCRLPAGRIRLDDKGVHTFEYAKEYILRRDEETTTLATLQTTGFDSGTLKGAYLLFKGGLNDSLIDALSRPMEVAFLWRWNPPFAFVEFQGGLKTLSASGRLVAAEAKAMRKIIAELAPQGHRFGLMHSISGREEVWLPPAHEGSAGYDSVLAYLDGFTEQRIYAEYKDYKDPRPDWAATAWKDSGEVAGARDGFLDGLRRIREGFAGAGTLQHIELIGVGHAPASEIDLKDPEIIEAILDSVTLSHAMGSWLGVDLGASLQTEANRDLRPTVLPADFGYGPLTLSLPVYRPASLEFRAFAGGRSHAIVMPLTPGQGREAILKSEIPFEDSLQLQGIDALGRETRVHGLAPRILRTAGDTGLARLWAADPDRISERGETDLGLRYGILTKGSYFSAGAGEGRLDPGRAVSLPKSVRLDRGQGFRVRGGMLLLGAPGRVTPGAWLEIFDSKGRFLGRLELARYRSGDGFAVPLALLSRFGAARVYLALRGAGRSRSYTLALGGRP